VLDISIYDLLPDDVAPVTEETRWHSVPTLREQLLSYRFVNPRYLRNRPTPVPVTVLQNEVNSLWDTYQRARFPFVIAALERLLPIAHSTINANTGTARTAAQIQMAYVYQVAATTLPKLGEQDLAMICADNADRRFKTRAMWPRQSAFTERSPTRCSRMGNTTTPSRSSITPSRIHRGATADQNCYRPSERFTSSAQ